MKRIIDVILAGTITLPIAATFPIEQTRDAVTLQAGRHIHGKIAIAPSPRLSRASRSIVCVHGVPSPISGWSRSMATRYRSPRVYPI